MNSVEDKFVVVHVEHNHGRLEAVYRAEDGEIYINDEVEEEAIVDYATAVQIRADFLIQDENEAFIEGLECGYVDPNFLAIVPVSELHNIPPYSRYPLDSPPLLTLYPLRSA